MKWEKDGFNDEVANKGDFQLRVFTESSWTGRWEITRIISKSGHRGLVAKGWDERSIKHAKRRAELVYEALTKRLR